MLRIAQKLPCGGGSSSRGLGSQNKTESLRLMSEVIDLAVLPSLVVGFGADIRIGPMLLEHAIHNVRQLMGSRDNGLANANPTFDALVIGTDGALATTGGLGRHAQGLASPVGGR